MPRATPTQFRVRFGPPTRDTNGLAKTGNRLAAPAGTLYLGPADKPAPRGQARVWPDRYGAFRHAHGLKPGGDWYVEASDADGNVVPW